MKFGNSSGFKNSIDLYIKRMGRVVAMPVTTLLRRGRMLTQPNSVVLKAGTDIKKKVKELKDPPKSLKEYLVIGNHYVAKKLLYLVALAAIIIPALFLNFLYPVLEEKFLTKTMPVDSVMVTGYTGKVRLTDRNTGKVVLNGKLEDGRINGVGILYDYEENKIYEGGFLTELYSGYGELYWPGGPVKYRGNFLLNQYNGQGILYDEQGKMVYEGSFVNGIYEGNGTLFQPDGTRLYQGSFEQGSYMGVGILYRDGHPFYEGEWKNGSQDGNGTQYSSDGTVTYSGTFSLGKRTGKGIYYQKGKRYTKENGRMTPMTERVFCMIP